MVAELGGGLSTLQLNITQVIIIIIWRTFCVLLPLYFVVEVRHENFGVCVLYIHLPD